VTYDLTIRKNTSGQWVVEPDGAVGVIKPGDTVAWRIGEGESAIAHLQFVDDIFEPSPEIDEHLVSKLEPGATLQLTVGGKALPDPRILRRTYGYAVAMVDAAGTTYAIGNNPPPELDIGG
jgi:hypothetical protein